MGLMDFKSRPTLSNLHQYRQSNLRRRGFFRVPHLVLYLVLILCFVLYVIVSRGQTSSSYWRASQAASKALRLKTSKLPLWKGWSSDRPPSQFATRTLVGSYKYPDVGNSAPSILYFPAVDLKDIIIRDEASDTVADVLKTQLKAGAFGGTSSRPRRVQAIGAASKSKTVHPVSSEFAKPTYTFKSNSSFPNHALLTRCGFKGVVSPSVRLNQDRAFLVSPYLDEEDWLMGLFDGHGIQGHVVSHFCALEMPKRLARHLALPAKSIPQALTDAFLEIEKDLPTQSMAAGSTAIVMLRQGDEVYVANTGDSLAIVASYDPIARVVKIEYQTKPHKPHLPEERKRIEAAGGQILEQPESGDLSSRVLIPAGADQMALAMSRSIGDKGGAELGVIANPTVDTLNLRRWSSGGTKLFVVAASDGLWDHIPPLAVAEHLAKNMYENEDDAKRPSLLEACEQLVMKASERWIANGVPYRDDITIAVNQLPVMV